MLRKDGDKMPERAKLGENASCAAITACGDGIWDERGKGGERGRQRSACPTTTPPPCARRTATGVAGAVDGDSGNWARRAGEPTVPRLCRCDGQDVADVSISATGCAAGAQGSRRQPTCSSRLACVLATGVVVGVGDPGVSTTTRGDVIGVQASWGREDTEESREENAFRGAGNGVTLRLCRPQVLDREKKRCRFASTYPCLAQQHLLAAGLGFCSTVGQI